MRSHFFKRALFRCFILSELAFEPDDGQIALRKCLFIVIIKSLGGGPPGETAIPRKYLYLCYKIKNFWLCRHISFQHFIIIMSWLICLVVAPTSKVNSAISSRRQKSELCMHYHHHRHVMWRTRNYNDLEYVFGVLVVKLTAENWLDIICVS